MDRVGFGPCRARLRVAARWGFAVALASLAGIVVAAPREPSLRLVDGSIVERTRIGTNDERLFVDASLGPLVVVLEQRGIDIVLQREGEPHQRNMPTGRYGSEVTLVDTPGTLALRARSAGAPAMSYRVQAFSLDSAAGRRLPRAVWEAWSQGHYENGAEDAKGYAAALLKLREVEHAVAALGDSDDLRTLRLGNAHLLRRLGRNDEAVAAYDGLIRGLDPVRQREWLTRASNGKGLSLRELDRFADADRAFADAERYGADRRDGYEWVSAKNNRCLILHHYGKLAAARDCYQAVIPLYRSIAPSQVVVPMLNLAAVADALGEPALALANYREALDLRRAGTDRSGLGYVLLNLASHEAQTGAWPDALDHSLEAQQVFETLGDRARIATVLNLRGWIYRELGEPGRARDYLAQALDAARESNDEGALASAKAALAELEPDDARAAAAQREAIDYLVRTRQAGFAAERGIALAERLDAMGDIAGRDAALAPSDALWGDDGNPASRARAATLRARAALREGRLDDAQARIAQAIALRRQTHETAELAAARLVKARIERRAGRTDAALVEIEKALAELQRAERLPASPVLAANLFDRRVELLDEALETLIGAHPSDAALARAWSLKWTYGKTPNAATRVVADAAERALLDELRAKVALLAGTRGPALGQRRAQPSEVQAQISRRVEEIESMLDAREAVVSRADGATLDLTAIAHALLPGEAFVGIGLGARASGAWVVTAAGPRWVALPPRARLLEFTRRMLADADEPSFAALSDAFAPLTAAVSTATRIVVVPDGPTWLVPFAGLRGADGRYWIDRASVSLLATPPSSPQRLRPIALAREFPVVVWGASEGTTLAMNTRAPQADTLRSGAGRLASLPGVSIELYLIRNALGARRVSTGSPYDLALPAYAEPWMLHVAGHGFADSAHPYASALALPTGGAETGFAMVSGRSVAWGTNPPSIVFVNACEGLAGRLYASQPPASLAAEFLHAGAGVVIAASWPVEDSRAARFAETFYRALDERPGDVAEALARAQRAVAQGRSGREPRHWSGYSLVQDGG